MDYYEMQSLSHETMQVFFFFIIGNTFASSPMFYFPACQFKQAETDKAKMAELNERDIKSPVVTVDFH